MAGHRSDSGSDLQIIIQCFFHLRTIVNHHFISAFAENLDPAVVEVDVFNVQTNQF